MRWIILILLASSLFGQTSRPSNIVTTDPTKTNTFAGPIKGDSANICSINGVFNVGGSCASSWGGGDIGAQINAAYAAGPSNGVHVFVIPGQYDYTTPIVTEGAKNIFLECSSAAQSNLSGNVPATTKLNYTPSSGTAMTITGYGDKISGCAFAGSGSSSTIGLQLGTDILSAFINGTIDKVDIGGFGVGLIFGYNVYIVSILNSVIHDNTGNVYIPGLTGIGENITFMGGAIANKNPAFSTTCINIQFGGDYHFRDISIDQCGITVNNVNVFVDFDSVHVENPNGATALPFFTFGTACNFCTLNIAGGEWIEDGTTGSRTEFIKDTSAVSNHGLQVNITSGTFIPNESVAQLVNFAGATCCSTVSVANYLNGFGGYTFANTFSSSGTFLLGMSMITGQDCGTTTSCATTQLVSPGALKLIKGQVALTSGTPSTATVTGFNPAFTSSSSFVCTVSNATTAVDALKVVNVSGTSITITGPNTVTDTVNYICVGT